LDDEKKLLPALYLDEGIVDGCMTLDQDENSSFTKALINLLAVRQRSFE